MSRSLVLGNGNILVGLDDHALVRDFYFPYVGLENHVGGHFVHRIGAWVDGAFSWLDDGSWNISIRMEKDSLEGNTTAVSRSLAVTLEFTDIVYNEKNIFVREVKVTNSAETKRTVKVFFAHEFEIYESHSAHTAYFDPIYKIIVHYKARRVFAVNARLEGKLFDDYTTGVFQIEGKEGSFRDAEDGNLSKNAIEHGPADSVIGLSGEYEPKETKLLHYWIAVGTTIDETVELNNYVLDREARHIVQTTHDFWKAWISKRKFSFPGLTQECTELFTKSLFVIRAHFNNNGAVIASSDSDILKGGKDTYNYVWHRDGAFAALAMGKAGYDSITKEFFKFSNDTISRLGYFMHKYNPDKSLGSSWHPWVREGVSELPIQEDETATVLFTLKHYYTGSRDLELIEQLYTSLIRKSADFMAGYRDEYTGLPKPSYDLWEERFGIHTYTASSVVGGLEAAAYFADILGKMDDYTRWSEAADGIRKAILKYLYNPKDKMFYRRATVTYDLSHDLAFKKADIAYDRTVDMSAPYGIFVFGVLPPDDARLKASMDTAEGALTCAKDGCAPGIARYAGDMYRNVDPFVANPWFITTLWRAQHLIALAKKEKDFDRPRKLIEWAVKNATPSGMLPEQIHPYSGAPLSVSPLTWSHSEYVRTVMLYLSRMEELGLCNNCNPVN